MYCTCASDSHGCPTCKPEKWIKEETDEYVMWIQKKEKEKELKIKKIRIVKRGQSTRAFFSEDGEAWHTVEGIWGLVGDYDINIDTEIEVGLKKDDIQTR